MRKRLVVLQALAILLAVFQYGMRAAGQEEGGNSDRILNSVFQPYLTARMPLAGSGVGEWLATKNRIRIGVYIHRRYRGMPLWRVLPRILIGMVCTYGNRTTRVIWCYCSDMAYLYQLMVKSVIFYTLTEWTALVNEMLLMMAGDVESNPGPPTQLTVHDLEVLKQLIQPVAAYWVELADQLGMSSLVVTIRSTPDNTVLTAFLRDLLYRWLTKGHPTLEELCQALRGDVGIIGGARVAYNLEQRFQGQREFETAHSRTVPEPTLKELVTVKVNSWYNLGLELDIADYDLQTIEMNHPQDQEGCKRDMFRTWLRMCPQASFRQLVQGLVEVGDVREADRLRKKYGINIDTPQSRATHVPISDLAKLSRLPVTAEWFTLGIQLGLSPDRLRIIQSDNVHYPDMAGRCLTDMLHFWITSDCVSTYEGLATALNAIGRNDLALEICSDQDQPTLTECIGLQGLKRRINIPQEIGTKYKVFGTLLLEDRTGEKVNAISRKHMNDAEKVNVSILEEWIAGRGKYPVTWKNLTETIRETELAVLAGEIEAAKLHTETQSSKSRHLFNEAMKHGYVLSRNTTVLFLGAAGSGKTCSKHVLMNELPPKERKSTPIAERPVKVYKMLTDNDLKWQKLSPEKQKEILTGIMRRRDQLKTAEKPIPATQSSSSEIPKPKSSISNSESSLPKAKSLLPISESSLPQPERHLETPASVHMATPSTIEEEFVTLLDELPDTVAEPLTEVDVVYITDSGGQPQFHEVLPIFLGHASVCIFVTKLSECLDAQPLVEYYDNGCLISKPQLAAQTNQQILKHCVRTMRSHRSEGKPPKILFIGTFKDLEHKCSDARAAKNEKLLKMLLPHFKDEVIYSNLPTNEVIFALNAQDPGNDEWKLAEGIREIIMTKCSPESNEIPLRWYALDLALQAIGKQVMSKAECFAEACKLHFDTESFEAALQYLHKLNIIFYYPKTLPNVIFTNRQVLLNKVTELVKESYKLRDKDSEVEPRTGDSRRFRDHALVTVEFLKSFDTHYIYEGNLFTPHDLVKLFRELLIFANFTSDDEYFMPCLLQILSNQEVANCRSSVATVPLVLHFPDGGPRLGIFCSLTVFLLSAANQFPSPWKLAVDSLGTPVCLHRNCIKFKIEGYPCMIVLIDTFSFFEVHVACSDDICPWLYFFVRKAMFAGLQEAASTLGYNNSHPNLAFLCFCHIEDLHLAVEEGSYWICTMDPERQTCLTLRNKHKMWLTTSEPPTGDDKTPIGPTKASSTDADKELATPLKPKDLKVLKPLLNCVAAYWVEIADQLEMTGEVDIIKQTPGYTVNSGLRNLLNRWLHRQCPLPTLEDLCQALRADDAIIGGAAVAENLKKIF